MWTCLRKLVVSVLYAWGFSGCIFFFGVLGIPVIDGLDTSRPAWRFFYWFCIALLGVCVVITICDVLVLRPRLIDQNQRALIEWDLEYPEPVRLADLPPGRLRQDTQT